MHFSLVTGRLWPHFEIAPYFEVQRLLQGHAYLERDAYFGVSMVRCLLESFSYLRTSAY